MADRPIKVAIIGGGCASITAAWELSKPEHAGRYQITVYQEGWRLGGKGASGRGVNGRIEEHGLHIWLGFYDNAFRMMRECHAELEAAGLGHLYGDWRDAWTPENDIALFSAAEGGGFERWTAHMPPRPGLPGDPRPASEAYSLQHYMASAFDLFRTLILDTAVDGRGFWETSKGEAPRSLGDQIASLAMLAAFTTAASLAESLGVVAAMIRNVSHLAPGLADNIEAVCERARSWLEDRWVADSEHRFLWEIADLTLAATLGLMREGIAFDPRGLDALEDHDCREWLGLHGASPRALQSPFIRGLYDLSMGYVQGDPDRPSQSAGQGLRGSLRTFFGYRGAFMWRMRAGMGDVVFAPLHTALERRGVRFAFFHRLTNVGLAGAPDARGRDHVRTLAFDVQARPVGGEAYAPLVEVAGRPCWPARPRFDQLEHGRALEAEERDFESFWDRRRAQEAVLTVGRDFDLVVLGVGLGVVPYVCRELVETNPRWRAMTENVETVASQAFQVWLTADLESLGWGGPAYITGAFAKPFDTWCDMAHVVPEEAWPERPMTSVYFCAVLPDPPVPPADSDRDYPARRAAEVRENAEAFLQGPIREAWPQAFGPDGQFRWELLASAPEMEAAGPARFATQYWRANVNPSDRYVIHTPGSFRHRISPLDMSYDNLTIAGDWTDSGFHSGCVEGAVMSGLLAAHALSGSPKLEDIIAYDHP